MKVLLVIISVFISFSVLGNDFISKEEAHRLVKKEKALLLDVRSTTEYAIKNIDGSKNIPLGDISTKIEEIKKLSGGKDKPIVVYCLSGGRSSNAKSQLEKAGFKKVYNLGGILRWY